MITTAIIPGTFDPITLGHQDIISRSAKWVDQIIIAVSQKQTKAPLLTLEKRIALIEQLYANHPNIKVTSFNGLLVSFAQQQKASLIIRGVRNTIDAAYEQELAQMNAKLAPEIETVLLFARPEHQMISSTWVREILVNHGDIQPFVDPSTASMLQDSI